MVEKPIMNMQTISTILRPWVSPQCRQQPASRWNTCRASFSPLFWSSIPFRRKYFCARMSTATWDQVSGTSTSLASKTTVPSSLEMRLVLGTNGIPSRGS